MADFDFNSLTDAVKISKTASRILVGKGSGHPDTVPLKRFGQYVRDSESFVGTFAKWQTAKARGATSPARFVAVGDSNVEGHGANSGTDLFTKGFARRLADDMSFLRGSIYGSQNVSSTLTGYEAYNTAVSHTGGWAIDSSASNIMGDKFFKLSSGGSAGAITWAPAETFDTLQVGYPTASGLGSITVTVDGSLIDTISENASSGYHVNTYSSLGHSTHTVAIGGTGSGDVYLQKLELQDRTLGTPVYCQAGWGGSKASDHIITSQLWQSLNQLDVENFDYVLYYCTINNLNDGDSSPTYAQNVETFVKTAAATADGCLCFGFPPNANNAQDGTAVIYAENLRHIAMDYGWSYYDCRESVGHSNARANDLGYRYDDKHPNQAGHDLIGDDLYDFLGGSLA